MQALDREINFDELAMDTVGQLIFSFAIIKGISFISNNIHYVSVPLRNGLRSIFKVADVCAADGTPTVPTTGLPDEFIPNSNTLPAGIKPGDTWYHTKPDLRAKYPNGIKFNLKGYPDFSEYAIKTVKVEGMKGVSDFDFLRANKAANISVIPEGYTWHHVEDGITMQLVPQDINSPKFGGVTHRGGAANIRNFFANMLKACVN